MKKYTLKESSLDEGFMDHLSKLTKLGEMGSKAKAVFTAIASFKDGEASEAIMAIIELMPESDEADSFKGKLGKFIEENKEVLSQINSTADAKKVIESIGAEKIEAYSESDEGSWLRDFKAYVVKHSEKFEQVLQVISNGDLDDFQEFAGFEVPSMVRSKAEQLLSNVSEKAGVQADKVAGFLELIAELPIAEEITTESRNLFSAMSDSALNESIKQLAETCSGIGNGYIEIDVPMNAYPAEHTSEDGRMLDYGSIKSDSQEGRMTKAKLFRLAQMAQSLHDRMQDGDDLPEWVQDKITTSEDRISSAHDYIDYKLRRINEGSISMVDILFETTADGDMIKTKYGVTSYKDLKANTTFRNDLKNAPGGEITMGAIGKMAPNVKRLSADDFKATDQSSSALTATEFQRIRDFFDNLVAPPAPPTPPGPAPIGDFSVDPGDTYVKPTYTNFNDWIKKGLGGRFLQLQGFNVTDSSNLEDIYLAANDFIAKYPTSDFTKSLRSLAKLADPTNVIDSTDKGELQKLLDSDSPLDVELKRLLMNIDDPAYTAAPADGVSIDSGIIVKATLKNGALNTADPSMAAHFQLTAQPSGVLISGANKSSDEIAEFISAKLLGPGSQKIGTHTHSYDAMAADKTKWEVKLLSGLGTTARLGASGASAGAAELTKIRNFIKNMRDRVLPELDSILKGDESLYNDDFTDPAKIPYQVVNNIREKVNAILSLTFGTYNWDMTDLNSLAARGEITSDRFDKIMQLVRDLDEVLMNCENYGDAAALAKAIEDWDNSGPVDNAFVGPDAKRAQRYFKDVLGYESPSMTLRQYKAGDTRSIFKRMGQQNPGATDIQKQICEIEGFVVRELGTYLEHIQDLPAAADYMSYAKNTLLGSAGFGSFVVDYCNAKEYTTSEKTKKAIAGFIFVVQNGSGNDFSKADVYIMGKDALQLAATSPHPTIGVQVMGQGFTQQTPSIGLR